MTHQFKQGDLVEWKWYGSLIDGSIEEIFFERTTRVLKGSTITRNGSPENPAYLVRSEAGNLALKLQSELQPRSKNFRMEHES